MSSGLISIQAFVMIKHVAFTVKTLMFTLINAEYSCSTLSAWLGNLGSRNTYQSHTHTIHACATSPYLKCTLKYLSGILSVSSSSGSVVNATDFHLDGTFSPGWEAHTWITEVWSVTYGIRKSKINVKVCPVLVHCVSKNCAKLFLSELGQISTNFDNFGQKDGK